jgi:uncharacterized membrane protein YfcA
MTEVLEALALGFAAGVLSGLFGVGGGILFVPTLTIVVGLTQLEAQATSLAAVIPVVLVGAWRQHRRGLVHGRAALVVGIASAGGVVGGALLANELGNDTLRILFAVLLLATAVQLAVSALRNDPRTTGDGPATPP